jgi:hypothetical protein
MSNLNSARQALQAELQHAKEGASFYQARIQALEDAIAKIDSVDTSDTRSQSTGKVRAAKGVGKKHAGRPRAEKSGGTDGALPATGKAFWMSLLSEQPKSSREILEAATTALGGSLSADQLKKLSQRQTNAFHNLVKSKEVSDSGSGRERLFFRA